MDDKTSNGMTIFNKKKAKNTNQGRERRRGLPKVVAPGAEEKAGVDTEEKAEAVTEEATVSQEQKTAQNSDTEKTLEETPKTTTDETTSVDSATDEVLETTNAEVSTDETRAETGTETEPQPEPEPTPVSDTPKPTTTSKDNRKQIKLSPYLMEKIDQIKRIKKMSYNYEVLDELVDDYVENQLTEEERAFFNMNMKFFKKDLE